MNSSAGRSDAYMNVDRELFLWSVINRRRNFNLLFWARGKNKICKRDFLPIIYIKIYLL